MASFASGSGTRLERPFHMENTRDCSEFKQMPDAVPNTASSLHAVQSIIGETALYRVTLIRSLYPVFAGGDDCRKLVARRRLSSRGSPLAQLGRSVRGCHGVPRGASDEAKEHKERHPPHLQHP